MLWVLLVRLGWRKARGYSQHCLCPGILALGGTRGDSVGLRSLIPSPGVSMQRCRSIPPPFLLQSFDDFIFAFFAVEMIVKMIALGIFGKKCYLGDTWNRLDFFIVIAG